MERSSVEKNNRVGLFYVATAVQHECRDFSHPESGKRLASLEEHLKQNPDLQNLKFVPQSELIAGCVELVHDSKYIEKIKRISRKVKKRNWYLDRKDTYIDSGTFEAAYLAASTACAAITYITENKLDYAFCAIRPPGHHASRREAAGFCIFNNVAIASKFFLNLHPEKKVLVIDWDTHFGNGTFSVVKKIDSIYFFDISTIDFPIIGKPKKPEIKNRQSLIQVPRSSTQSEYLKKFSSQVEKIQQTFSPDIVLVSAGFDTHKRDPMRGFSLEEKAYFEMTKKLTDTFANIPVISVLEGGYNAQALVASIEQHLLALSSR
ncbi:MAG TPA: histone deacetylase [Patescibacteria group bacterium]